MENQQEQSTISYGSGETLYSETVVSQYVDITKYNNAYAPNKKARRQHPVLKKIGFNMLGGLIFGICAGFGVYMILVFSGVTGRLAKVEDAAQELELVKEDILEEVSQQQMIAQKEQEQEKETRKNDAIGKITGMGW